VENFAYKEKTG